MGCSSRSLGGPSPDGRSVALASRGWLWLLDLDTRRARRITSGAAIDARQAWSPSGDRLAFVRDDTRETWVVVLDVATGGETVVAEALGFELDPAFTPDGDALLNAAAGDAGIGLRRLVPEAGHLVMLEQPAAVHARLVAFLDG